MEESEENQVKPQDSRCRGRESSFGQSVHEAAACSWTAAVKLLTDVFVTAVSHEQKRSRWILAYSGHIQLPGELQVDTQTLGSRCPSSVVDMLNFLI